MPMQQSPLCERRVIIAAQPGSGPNGYMWVIREPAMYTGKGTPGMLETWTSFLLVSRPETVLTTGAGSQPSITNAYSQFITYTQLPFAGRPGFVNDITYGNPNLKNERAREWEVGADVGFLDGRVSTEATYYNRLVSDLLFFKPLPTSTGFSAYPPDLPGVRFHRHRT